MQKIYEKIKTPRKLGAVMKWEKYNAHKRWIVRYGGVNYYFYCACADNERFIALAVSD